MRNIFKLFIPAIIPSWRFFDFIAPSPRIEVRFFKNKPTQNQKWMEFLPASNTASPIKILSHLFYNPHRNQRLFMAACAERIAQDHCPYAKRDIETAIRSSSYHLNSTHFQYRLKFIYREQSDIAFNSPTHVIEENYHDI